MYMLCPNCGGIIRPLWAFSFLGLIAVAGIKAVNGAAAMSFGKWERLVESFLLEHVEK